ncbi:MAG: hypothetical protein JW829_08475, partial [Pirellulales bacterium]|nr:hypothetical protein [Pirellulales bacterium]
MLAVIQWDGGLTGTGTNWHEAENWVGDVLPAAADDVQIGAAFSGITISSNSNVTINSLTSMAAIQFIGGTFNIATDSTINNDVFVSSGVLDGSGDLTVAGRFNWTGGTMSGSGQLVAQGGMAIGGSGAKYL